MLFLLRATSLVPLAIGLSPSAVAADLDDAIRNSMTKHNVPGVSIAIIRSGRVTLAKGFGVLKAGSPQAVDDKTIFQAASVSKPVTAMAALHLVERGMFGLDDDVNSVLKSWKLPANPLTEKQPVTVRRILCHTAGLSVGGFPGYEVGTQLPTIRQILDGLPPANSDPIRVQTAPGAEYRYSGGGYTLLRFLMEDVTKRVFADLMRDVVLLPLKMARSTFSQLLGGEEKNVALAHQRTGEPFQGGWFVYPELAPDGLWSTPTELANFAVEVWRAGEGKSTRVIGHENARLMVTRQLGQHGLGFEVHGEGSGLRFRHDGGNRGYRCRLLFFPALGDGVVIMTNSGQGDRVIVDAMQALRSMYSWPQ